MYSLPQPVILQPIVNSWTAWLGAAAMICWGATVSEAQLADTARHLVEEGWIEKMNNNISIKLSANNAFEIFKVHTPGNDIVLYPNIATKLRLSGNYKFLALSVGTVPGFLPGNKDDDIKGNTRAFDLSASFLFRHWFQHFQYARVQGYYLRNTADYQPWESGDPFLQFPDLLNKGIRGSTGFQFNPKLSIKSLVTQTERQLKSAGSFVTVLQYHYYRIDDRSTPQGGGSTQMSDNFEWGIGAGYYHNFVWKEKFYAGVGFVPSGGFIHTWLTTRLPGGDVRSMQNNPAFRWRGHGAIGYNGRDVFSGFYFTYSDISFRQEGTAAVDHNTRWFFHLFFGIRLKAPTGLRRSFSALEDMVGMKN